MPEYTPFRSGELCKTIKLFGECNEREKTLLTSLLKKDCERKMFILQPWRIKTTKLTAQVWKIATQTFLLWWVIFMYFHFDRLSGRSYGSIRGAYTYFLPRAHRAARYTFLFFFPPSVTIQHLSHGAFWVLLPSLRSMDLLFLFSFFLFHTFMFLVFSCFAEDFEKPSVLTWKSIAVERRFAKVASGKIVNVWWESCGKC